MANPFELVPAKVATSVIERSSRLEFEPTITPPVVVSGSDRVGVVCTSYIRQSELDNNLGVIYNGKYLTIAGFESYGSTLRFIRPTSYELAQLGLHLYNPYIYVNSETMEDFYFVKLYNIDMVNPKNLTLNSYVIQEQGFAPGVPFSGMGSNISEMQWLTSIRAGSMQFSTALPPIDSDESSSLLNTTLSIDSANSSGTVSLAPKNAPMSTHVSIQKLIPEAYYTSPCTIALKFKYRGDTLYAVSKMQFGLSDSYSICDSLVNAINDAITDYWVMNNITPPAYLANSTNTNDPYYEVVSINSAIRTGEFFILNAHLNAQPPILARTLPEFGTMNTSTVSGQTVLFEYLFAGNGEPYFWDRQGSIIHPQIHPSWDEIMAGTDGNSPGTYNGVEYTAIDSVITIIPTGEAQLKVELENYYGRPITGGFLDLGIDDTFILDSNGNSNPSLAKPFNIYSRKFTLGQAA